MRKVSETDINLLITEVRENKMGMALIEADVKNFIDIMVKEKTYEDRYRICGDEEHITIQIFPVNYKRSEDVESGLTKTRMIAVQTLFERWCKLGQNKTRAKTPFACKKFMEYLKEIKYHSADYVVFWVI